MIDPTLDRCCAVCGQTLTTEPWILLNRYALGTGKARGCIQGNNEQRGYLWEIGGAEEFVSGMLLHWPTCAQMFIEAKMVEVDFSVSRQGD